MTAPGWAAAVADALLPWALVSAKAGALVCLGGTAAVLLRRSSASGRHLAWAAAVLAVLLLPAAGPLLPEVRVLPALPDASPAAAASAEPSATGRPPAGSRPLRPS